jgi:prevent-host-death family protein
MMKSTGIKELRSSLRETLEQVKAGESVIVTERGEPIARIVPIEPHEARMERLIRSGAIRPPLRPVDEAFVKDLLSRPLPEDPEGCLVNALLEERGSSR